MEVEDYRMALPRFMLWRPCTYRYVLALARTDGDDGAVLYYWSSLKLKTSVTRTFNMCVSDGSFGAGLFA